MGHNTLSMAPSTCTHFQLMPGDATCYQFTMMNLFENPVLIEEADDPYTRKNEYGSQHVVSGTTGEYVMIAVTCPGNGVMVVHRNQLLDLHKHVVGYVEGKTGMDCYTIAAILLAAQVLVKAASCHDLQAAAKNMLRAPELLQDGTDARGVSAELTKIRGG